MNIQGAAFRLDVVFGPVVTVLMYLPVILPVLLVTGAAVTVSVLLIRRAKRKQAETRKREKERESADRKEKP